MSKRVDVALIGASGPVAEAVLEILGERRFPVGELSVLVLDPEDDANIEFMGRPLLLEDARQFDFSQVQLVFLSDADPELTALAERAADAGAVVVDASNQAWSDPAIPRVLATLNAGALARFNERGIVAAPDRLSVALAPLLAALAADGGLRGASITGLLPASDFGRAALEDLARETTALLNMRHYERRHYAQQIAFNVLAQDADAGADGSTERERRVTEELMALLAPATPSLELSLLAAPVFYGMSANLTLRFAEPVALARVREQLAAVPNVVIDDTRSAGELPSPVRDAPLGAALRIARLRCSADGHSLMFWLSTDGIRLCGAQNAVLSAEILVRDYL